MRGLGLRWHYDESPVVLAGIANGMRNALIIMLRHHGDVLLSTPLIHALKRLEPDTNIDLLLYSYATDLVQHHPQVAEIHCIDRRWKEQGTMALLRHEAKLFKRLRAKNYKLMITLTDQWRGAILSRVLNPETSIALTMVKRNVPLWRNSFTVQYPMIAKRYMVDLHLDALRVMGYELLESDRQVSLKIPERERQSLVQRLSSLGVEDEKFVMLHPTSRGMHKCWDLEKYVRLIDALHTNGVTVIVSAAPEQQEMEFIRSILQGCQRSPMDLSGQLSLLELAALIDVASLLVCVDSVPMHMAAALGTPAVALFGPTDEKQWGPQVDHIEILASSRDCRPCLQQGCKNSGYSECLGDIEVEQVLGAALRNTR